MNKTDDEEKLKKVKRITLINTVATLPSYAIPALLTYLGVFLDLSSTQYRYIHYLAFFIIFSVMCFSLIVYFKKRVTVYFSQVIGIAQFVNWLFISIIWLVLLNEIRVVALFCFLIVFVFIFTVGNVATSIFIMATSQLSYLAVSYYCITHLGQAGSFKQELFHSYAFFYSTIFLLIMSQTFKKQRKQMNKAREVAERTRKNLEQSNTDISVTNEGIRKLVEEVVVLSEQVAEESALITDSSETLVDGASIQVNSINDVAETMNRINDKTSTNSDSSFKVNELVHFTKEFSSDGVLQMKEMSSAIDDITTSGKAISEIVNTIDGIAFKTNLLAHNAAVEAARAGKHGKGFAVVAQEVRNLATRSAEAANLTTEMIDKTIMKVETGTELSKAAVVALDDINEKITTISAFVEGIAVSSKEQRDEISRVNKSMGKIADITNKNSVNAKQTRVAAGKLSNTAKKINQLLNSFNSR